MNFFSKDAPWKALQKLYDWTPFCLPKWFFLYSKWITNKPMSLPIILKIFKRLFWFAIGICAYSFCRAFDGTSFKTKFNILSFSQVEIHAKQKSLPNIFIMLNAVGQIIIMLLFHFEYGKNDQNKSIGICLYNFCRAFHGASFKRKIKISSIC